MASPWNALLESLHSSLIDELNERMPDHKPELGMPKRISNTERPSPGLLPIYWARVSLESSPPSNNAPTVKAMGWVAVAVDETATQLLQNDIFKFWHAVLARAQTSEFSRRGIKPIFESLDSLTQATAKMVIWMPFRMQNAQIFLGVGI